jgi:glycosyltransferase involved in cell wall biosynthesis
LIAIAHEYEKEWARWEERQWLARELASVSDNLAIFGPAAGWLQCPEAAPYYRGYLGTPTQLAEAFAKSRLIVHTGALQMHFRVLEAMASARPVLVNRTSPGFGRDFGAIDEHFEEGGEYVEYDRANLRDVSASLLADPERRRMIGNRARAAIERGHLWRHRAEQIMKDLS